MKMLTLLGVFIFSISAHAINGRTTYQARIVKPDGYPLEASSVNFRFTVLDPTGSCVMYVEDYGAVNMTSSGGLISFALGTGTVSFPASSTATTFSTTFDNAVTSFSCQSPGIYNPTPTDNRKIVMQFNDGNGWQTLPSMAINAVPYAMYAAKSQDSQKLNGKADTAFVQKASDIPTCAAGKMLYFNNASFSCVDVPAVGTSINSVSASGSALSITGTASDPVVTMSAASMSQDGYLSSTDWNTFNNKQAATSAAIIATLGYTPADNAASGTYAQKANNLSDLTSSATARTNLGLGTFATASAIDLGSASATGTLAIARLPSFIGDATIATASNTIILSNSGVTAGTYTKVSVDAKGRVTSSSALSSSDVTTALGYTPANSTSGVTSLNGSTSQTQTFATSDTGTAFGISTENGVHTFAIPQAASSSVTAGLLSNADYTTFTNKQNATSSAIIATLGYTPANATSATQWTTNGSSIYYNTGNIGVGIVNPSAKLELASGTASIAPLKLTSGTLLSSAQSGTMEYDGFNFYLTDSTNTRRAIATGSNANTIDNVSTINSSGNISMVPVGAVIVSSTTASTNSNTGALVVKGGLGVAGNINTAGNLNVSGSQVIDGSLKLTSMTSGSVLFAGASGTVTQDNSNFFWDGANKRLGIGSNSPAQTLSVSGTGYFSGNVGIGTTSPLDKLHVEGVGRFSSASGQAAVVLYGGDVGAIDSQITFRTSRTSLASPSAIQTNDIVGSFFAAPYNGAAYAHNAQFSFMTDTASQGTGVLIKTGTSGIRTERFRITSTGNVGIGTSAPAAALDVRNTASGSNTVFHVFSPNLVSGTYNQMRLGMLASANNSAELRFYNVGGLGSTSNFGALALYGQAIPSISFNGIGNVGIGTSAPTSLLEVVSGTASAFINIQGAESQGSGVRFFSKRGTASETVGSSNPSADNKGWSFGTINDQSAATTRRNNLEASYWNGTAWTTAMVMTASGNIGMGTMTPAYKLSMYDGAGSVVHNIESGNNGSAAYTRTAGKTDAGVSQVYGSGLNITNGSGGYEIYDFTAGASRMYVSSTGNIGIGTTNPAYNLHIMQPVSGPTSVTLDSFSGTPGIYFRKANGTAAAPQAVSNATALLEIAAVGHGQTAYLASSAAKMIMAADEDWTDATGAASIRFHTRASSSTGSSLERMRIDKNGNVGIGRAAPGSRLHVGTPSSATVNNRFVSGNSNSDLVDATGLSGEVMLDHFVGAKFQATASTTLTRLATIKIDNAPTVSGSLTVPELLALYVQSGNSAFGGNLGIGTTSPSYKLDVSGTINIASGSALAFGGTSVCTAAGCTSSSDERLKENIKPLDFDLNKLLSLNAVQYDWKNKSKYGDKHQIGFIAQNLEKVYPEVVYTDQNTGLKSVTYGHLVAPIIEALKSIYNRLLGLETRIDRQIASIVESKADKAEIELLKQKAANLEAKAAKVDKLEAENEAKAKEIDALKAYLCSKDPAASICK